jgi:hypothetical protein
MVVRTRGRWVLLVIGAVILLFLILYPWWSGCAIDSNQVQVSLTRRWVVGYAAGLTFNISNHASCDLHLERVTITVHTATYHDGSAENLEFTETQDMTIVIAPGQAEEVDFAFDHQFRSSPTQLTARVEMSFREVGTVLVLDGEVQIPPRS